MGQTLERILVVDDDQGILDSFDVLLGDRYHLVKAENGCEALKILEKDLPKLMFLDIRMPGLDGIELMRRIREDQKDVKVVIITATNQEKTEEDVKSLGAISYLRKPLDVFEINRIAARVFS